MKPHTYNSTKVERAGTAATFVDVLTSGLIGARVDQRIGPWSRSATFTLMAR